MNYNPSSLYTITHFPVKNILKMVHWRTIKISILCKMFTYLKEKLAVEKKTNY